MMAEAHPSDARIERIAELPPDFADIVELSTKEQFGAMRRLREEWHSGANRFDAPGEALFEARVGPRLVGVCGLNRDPYLASPEVGRVRHLYVDPDFRRRGIGTRLVSKIVECSRHRFSRLRLRTMDAEADRFYVSIGFRRVVGESNATHEWIGDAREIGGSAWR